MHTTSLSKNKLSLATKAFNCSTKKKCLKRFYNLLKNTIGFFYEVVFNCFTDQMV